MAFAENLKSLRMAKDIGQKSLAWDLKTTVKSVSHWETGYSEPSISQLIAIADYFEVTLDELVGRDERQENRRKP